MPLSYSLSVEVHRSNHGSVLRKKALLKTSQNPKENIWGRVSFLIKFIKETLAQE